MPIQVISSCLISLQVLMKQLLVSLRTSLCEAFLLSTFSINVFWSEFLCHFYTTDQVRFALFSELLMYFLLLRHFALLNIFFTMLQYFYSIILILDHLSHIFVKIYLIYLRPAVNQCCFLRKILYIFLIINIRI